MLTLNKQINKYKINPVSLAYSMRLSSVPQLKKIAFFRVNVRVQESSSIIIVLINVAYHLAILNS